MRKYATILLLGGLFSFAMVHVFTLYKCKKETESFEKKNTHPAYSMLLQKVHNDKENNVNTENSLKEKNGIFTDIAIEKDKKITNSVQTRTKPNWKHYYTTDVQLSFTQIKKIMSVITPTSRFLVFGVGYDSKMWNAAENTEGTTLFVENHYEWMTKIKTLHPSLNVEFVDYMCNMKDAFSVFMHNEKKLMEGFPLYLKNTQWDVILVDSPMGGGGHDNPGRMKSIYWASRIISPKGHLFVHDIGRDIENQFSRVYIERGLGRKRETVADLAYFPPEKKIATGDERNNISNRASACLLMMDTRKLQPEFPTESWHFTTAINKEYALRHGYAFEAIQLFPSEYSRSSSWQKLKEIGKKLEIYETVLYLDSDAYIYTPQIRFDEIPSDKTLTLWEDERRNNPNAGVMIWKKSSAAFILLDAWWNAYSGPSSLHEQDAMHATIFERYREDILLLPSQGFISDERSDYKKKIAGWRHDVRGVPFVVHLWGNIKNSRMHPFVLDILREHLSKSGVHIQRR